MAAASLPLSRTPTPTLLFSLLLLCYTQHHGSTLFFFFFMLQMKGSEPYKNKMKPKSSLFAHVFFGIVMWLAVGEGVEGVMKLLNLPPQGSPESHRRHSRRGFEAWAKWAFKWFVEREERGIPLKICKSILFFKFNLFILVLDLGQFFDADGADLLWLRGTVTRIVLLYNSLFSIF